MIKTLKRMFSTCGCNKSRQNKRQTRKRSGIKRTAKTYRGGYRLSSKSRKTIK